MQRALEPRVVGVEREKEWLWRQRRGVRYEPVQTAQRCHGLCSDGYARLCSGRQREKNALHARVDERHRAEKQRRDFEDGSGGGGLHVAHRVVEQVHDARQHVRADDSKVSPRMSHDLGENAQRVLAALSGTRREERCNEGDAPRLAERRNLGRIAERAIDLEKKLLLLERGERRQSVRDFERAEQLQRAPRRQRRGRRGCVACG
eukprot:Amastigsp_a342612_4.p3 type:complete len:205 gc:universal Amastigsp_a342612_4:739-1353(+)